MATIDSLEKRIQRLETRSRGHRGPSPCDFPIAVQEALFRIRRATNKGNDTQPHIDCARDLLERWEGGEPMAMYTTPEPMNQQQWRAYASH